MNFDENQDKQNNDTVDSSAQKRGNLKIYLGALAGVGKTYAMLAEAHRRLQQGEDIVAGIIVTHGRKEINRMAAGIERIPLKNIEYSGRVFEEMDTDAVIARRPKTVLVDELAHTNIPGARHAKRWQSVNEILDAGINVMSTLNVQHLESLNDKVFEITGVHVRETLPDSVVETADEVVLVDITSEALIDRLRRGDIYDHTKIQQALENFFRAEHISGLRELALRQTADRVDERRQDCLKEQKESKTISVYERVAVFVKLDKKYIKFIRRVYRLVRRLNAEFWVVFVRYPGMRLTSEEESSMKKFQKFSHNFGAEFVEIEGESVPEEIINFAKEKQITLIVLGQSFSSRLSGILREPIVTSVVRKVRDMDVLIIAESEKPDS
ncbi:MAG: universal stress protein [Firmicutes bacterium]|nr:universal stress protein [Bacillota bacterium]